MRFHARRTVNNNERVSDQWFATHTSSDACERNATAQETSSVHNFLTQYETVKDELLPLPCHLYYNERSHRRHQPR